jgi:hypothetical protein
MGDKWKEALEELGERARNLLAELGVLEPEPELVPVPVRNRRRPRRGERPKR